MSAVNVIDSRFVLFFAAALICAQLVAVDYAYAQKKIRSPGAGSLAAQLNKMTKKSAPSASRANGNGRNGNGITKLNVIDIIGANELGDGFRLPTAVFCDLNTDEIYVVDGGVISVYGDNFFPVASLGNGRGIFTATGVYVDKQGDVYVPQAAYYDEPARITVYNAAFFQTGQIYLNEFPGTEGYNPKSLVISDAGNMYITFDSGMRGVLVLDKQRQFSHWLRPIDLIFDQAIIKQFRSASEQEEEAGEVEAAQVAEESLFDIAELIPMLSPGESEQDFIVEDEPGLGPVQVTDISRDSNGNLYVLSVETGKVYIYTPDEEYLYSFGEQGGTTGKLSQPRKLVVDEKKKAIYIVDYNRHAILIYDLSGRFMHEFGGKGNRPGWFQYPASLATNTEGNIIVADMYNRRVQVLDVQFQYKFPLFQVPFVYDPNELFRPRPIHTSENMYYGPGFEEGEQASMDASGGGRDSIRSILEEAEGVI